MDLLRKRLLVDLHRPHVLKKGKQRPFINEAPHILVSLEVCLTNFKSFSLLLNPNIPTLPQALGNYLKDGWDEASNMVKKPFWQSMYIPVNALYRKSRSEQEHHCQGHDCETRSKEMDLQRFIFLS